jgi:thiosulfate/3-mercaptopyruvate sulfurtransferase
MNTLIAADRLAAQLSSDELVIFDASFYLPTEPQDAQALFEAAHLPRAQFFDIDRIADRQSALPHMLPEPDEFAEAMRALGVSDGSRVVVYDQRGIFSAPRVWWMFKAFGHDNVAVLDGGLPEWRRQGLPVETGAAQPRRRGDFTARYRPELVRSLHDMRNKLARRDETVLDARAAGRFSGAVPEPRPGMRSGHYPGAASLPFTELLNEDGMMKPPEALRASFAKAGVTDARGIVTMCGSGVTAAVLTLGLAEAGFPLGALYDGSWTEWGGRSDTEIETSA